MALPPVDIICPIKHDEHQTRGVVFACELMGHAATHHGKPSWPKPCGLMVGQFRKRRTWPETQAQACELETDLQNSAKVLFAPMFSCEDRVASVASSRRTAREKNRSIRHHRNPMVWCP